MINVGSNPNNLPGFQALPEFQRQFYSREMLFLAQPRLRFRQFAQVKRGLQNGGFAGITFTKMNNLTGGGYLSETDTLVPKSMASSAVVINVNEAANSVQLSEKLIRTSILDAMGTATRLLAANLALVQDTMFRDTALGTTNILYGGQGTLTPPSNASQLALGDGLDAETVRAMTEALSNNNTPRFEGQYYVAIVAPHQIRQLKADPNWQAVNVYQNQGRQIYIGEVGMYDGFVFIETTQTNTLTTTQFNNKYGVVSTVPQVWEGVFFGENAYGYAEALAPELRDDGVVELGRKHTIGWYGIWGMGLIEERNIFRLVTA